MKKEEPLHQAICQFIRIQYPGTIFNSDAAGVKLTKGQAVKMRMLQSDRGYLDLQILEARGGYIGFFQEIKSEGVTVWNKNGSLRKDRHLEEQWKMILRLRILGYMADFAIGFEQAEQQIRHYKSLPVTITQ